jgi:phytoene synthase
MASAQEITRKAKSNLAITLTCLPKERKQGMTTFYAFCRVIDDLADDLDIPIATRETGLQNWRDGINNGFSEPDELQSQVTQLIKHYKIPTQPFLDLIDGCASDLQPQRFPTWKELENYTYRVACCVGLISTRIFGCTHPDSEKYAVALGHALQLTNILRDVHEDLDNGGRIYLPLDDLASFKLTEEDLSNHVSDERFVAMMNHQADRAETFYQEALSHLTPEDTKPLKAAEAMRKIYHALLKKMRADNFQVFKQRYTVSKARKAVVLIGTLLP